MDFFVLLLVGAFLIAAAIIVGDEYRTPRSMISCLCGAVGVSIVIYAIACAVAAA